MKIFRFCLGFVLVFISFCNSGFAANNYVFDPKSPYHSLYIPNGKGPFPAILLLHASTGVVKINHTWANLLKEQGYIVYIIDSFKPRGWKDRESIGWEKATTAQLTDVAPAFQYLSHLSLVDSNRIGLLGFSMGGFDVLRVMERHPSPLEKFHTIPFKVAASFYGVCHRLAAETQLKNNTMIFIGDEDDRSTTKDCMQLIERSKSNNISIKIYKQSLHGFDNFEFPKKKEVVDEKGEHYHIGYNAEATQLAFVDLPKFFDHYLK